MNHLRQHQILCEKIEIATAKLFRELESSLISVRDNFGGGGGGPLQPPPTTHHHPLPPPPASPQRDQPFLYPTLYLSNSYSVSTTAFSNFLLCSYPFFIGPYKLLLSSLFYHLSARHGGRRCTLPPTLLQLFSSYACVPSLHLSIFLLVSTTAFFF